MSRITSCDGDLDDLGVLITRAYGVERDWWKQALCRSWKTTELIPSPWQFDPTQVVLVTLSDGTTSGLTGREMIRLALMQCKRCPAQYECARYAVKAGMIAGTWAMKIVDLKELHKLELDEAFAVIQAAEDEGVPVQVYVRTWRGVDASAA